MPEASMSIISHLFMTNRRANVFLIALWALGSTLPSAAGDAMSAYEKRDYVTALRKF